MEKTVIQKKEFYHKLIALVLPVAFQQFMLALVSASDAVMLGMTDQDALSAVSLAGQIQFVFNLFLAAMTIGMSMLVAQYWGKGDRQAVGHVFAIVMKVTVLVSLGFTVVATAFPALLMRIFTADEVLIQGGVSYLRIVGISYLLCGASQIYLCLMKNAGLAKKSTLISSVAVVVNIVLNAVLIFGLLGAPKMHIAGAALATVIARVTELVWTVADSGRPGRIRLKVEYIRQPDQKLKRDFWKYTTPVLGNEVVWGCGFTMYSVIMGHLGSDAVAANSIANIVKNLVACFCMGLGGGGGIITGHELGAGHLEKAKEYGRQLCRLAIISGLISGLFLLAISPWILNIVSLTEEARRYLKWMLVMCSYYMVGKSVNGATIAGIFCAGGDSRFGLLCDAVTMWCVSVPLGLIAAFWLKLPVLAVYFIVNLDEMIKLPAVYIHYRKYIWVRDLTSSKN